MKFKEKGDAVINSPISHLVLFSNLSDCCGCGACYQACKNHAISMEFDDEGFLYPHLNDSLCVKCLCCIKVCPLKKRRNR